MQFINQTLEAIENFFNRVSNSVIDIDLVCWIHNITQNLIHNE